MWLVNWILDCCEKTLYKQLPLFKQPMQFFEKKLKHRPNKISVFATIPMLKMSSNAKYNEDE